MAVPAALIPLSPLVALPPISTPSLTTSSSSSSSPPTSTATAAAAATAAPSPCPSLAPQQNLFRSELLAGGGSPGCIPNAALPPGKPVYSTPSPVENIPQNNECKMVELRGAKVASFTVDGQELICLPQAFDLFLKHLVGGLHTVYTKLKRLEITPVVCNVEQVRILRGLGAIQPGVNRCKLISRKDFETLYNDCTNASCTAPSTHAGMEGTAACNLAAAASGTSQGGNDTGSHSSSSAQERLRCLRRCLLKG
ncbi:Dachshund 1 [Liparis tanakae]|uniref:Dachshund 1 n=1 Tax=Liparis tanakae TaxID=230148 RepID=A0A4Z2FAK7_9TELE|nr:Dachshund 1 [Liparis tanakae]